MAGHSKWSTIKRKKGANDAKRGKLFTKLGKAISVAARNGSDPEMNSALRVAIDNAKRANLPKDNIDKAIQKGAGELPGVVYEEITYEGYGPGGIAMVIECVTDNTNRTVSFVRSTLKKAGGSLGSAGSVMYMFEKMGVIRVATEETGGMDMDDIELLAIDSGAEDILREAGGMTIYTTREELTQLTQVLESAGVVVATSNIELVTSNMMELDEKIEASMNNLIEVLEDNDDITSISTNANV